MSVRLYFVTLLKERPHKSGKSLCDHPLDEKGCFDPKVIQKEQETVAIANDSLGDWRVEIYTRLIPVFDVHSERT